MNYLKIGNIVGFIDNVINDLREHEDDEIVCLQSYRSYRDSRPSSKDPVLVLSNGVLKLQDLYFKSADFADDDTPYISVGDLMEMLCDIQDYLCDYDMDEDYIYLDYANDVSSPKMIVAKGAFSLNLDNINIVEGGIEEDEENIIDNTDYRYYTIGESMQLSEAQKILNENGYELLEEGTFGKIIGAGALVLGSLFGHSFGSEGYVLKNDIGEGKLYQTEEEAKQYTLDYFKDEFPDKECKAKKYGIVCKDKELVHFILTTKVPGFTSRVSELDFKLHKYDSKTKSNINYMKIYKENGETTTYMASDAGVWTKISCDDFGVITDKQVFKDKKEYNKIVDYYKTLMQND